MRYYAGLMAAPRSRRRSRCGGAAAPAAAPQPAGTASHLWHISRSWQLCTAAHHMQKAGDLLLVL